jgi:hypothetical protein
MEEKPKRRAAVWIENHKSSIISYTTLVVVLLFAYHFVSDGDFSFLMVSGL